MPNPSQSSEFDYYQILELEETATIDQIKAAKKKLFLKYHPDRNNNSPESVKKFQQLNEACEVLLDTKKRAQYDAERKKPKVEPRSEPKAEPSVFTYPKSTPRPDPTFFNHQQGPTSHHHFDAEETCSAGFFEDEEAAASSDTDYSFHVDSARDTYDSGVFEDNDVDVEIDALFRAIIIREIQRQILQALVVQLFSLQLMRQSAFNNIVFQSLNQTPIFSLRI